LYECFIERFHNRHSLLRGVAHGPGDTYLFPLQDVFFDDMGMEYYFQAYEDGPNSDASPADSTYYLTRTVFNHTNSGSSVTAGGGSK